MRFAYFLLADAHSVSEGKLNLLGIGVRKVQPDVLPATVVLSIAGSIEGTLDEKEKRHLDLTLTDPEGNVTSLASTEAALAGDKTSPALPASFLFIVNFGLPYTRAGEYVLRARFGDLEEQYVFMVEPKGKGRAPKRARKAAATKRAKAKA